MIERDGCSEVVERPSSVVDLVYEQSIDEVARIIGVPPNTVKNRIFHARKRIAEMLAARGIERAWL